ncbi:D(5)-like dopamine receptor [Scomber scombrus]|uniref:D(5)-like dopamine receptor n=1 Tax=Scomber scombrus TaxID=13677 RepID=A0AAV1QJX1_SCOSC
MFDKTFKERFKKRTNCLIITEIRVELLLENLFGFVRVRETLTEFEVETRSSPTGTNPTGTSPTGTNPTGTSPTGISPTGTNPTGISPTGTSPTGTNPTGTSPTGTNPTGTSPTGTNPTGTSPTGINPTGISPTGTNPTGISPTGTNPTGTNPTGISPTGTSPTGTNPTGISPTGTSPTGTNPTGTNPTGISPTGTSPTGTNPTGISPTGTSPTGTNPTDDCNASLNRTYAISSSLISFYIPVVIMVGTYTRIFRIAQTQIRRISSLERAAGPRASTHDESSLKTSFKRETKVLKTLSIIMGVFVFCWLPFFVLNCVVPFCHLDKVGEPPCVSDTTFSIFVWFGWANSSLNPVIYAFNADFRKAFSTILGCNKYCSTSTVETVDFSNELVSYHHDTTMQKEACAMPGPGPQRLAACMLPPPHAGADLEQNSDKVSVISDDSLNHKNLLLPAILQYECEAEISLDMMPFNSSGPTDCYVIPGQIRDLVTHSVCFMELYEQVERCDSDSVQMERSELINIQLPARQERRKREEDDQSHRLTDV